MKDYFDLHALAREGVIDAAILADAITATFERRVTEVPKVVPPGLTDTFASEPSAQAQWKATEPWLTVCLVCETVAHDQHPKELPSRNRGVA